MKRFISYLKKYKFYIILVVALTFLDVMTELFLPDLMSKIVDNGIARGDTSYILRVGIKMLGVALLASISMIVSSYYSSKAAMGFSKDLREDVFKHINSFSLGEFSEIGTSSLITRTTNDINQLQQVLMMGLRMMLRAPLMLVGGLFMAISKNKDLSLVLLVSMPILIGSIVFIGRKGFPLFKTVQKRIDDLNLVLREKLTGIRVIRAFDRVHYEEERFAEANKNLSDTNLKVNRLMLSMFPIVSVILNFTTVAILWFGAKQIDLGNMHIGDIMAFIQYVMLIMFSLIMFSVIFVVIPRAMASAERIKEVLDMKPSIGDSENSEELKQVESLSFENVSFAYENGEKNTLCNINFKVDKGETLAIIGGTGSGKTSLINLIPRFFDPIEGEVKINGKNIKTYDQKSLRSKIGYVPQKAVLFSGTIEDNIRQGREDASIEEIEKAAKISQSEEFIKNLEDGYKSFVSQGGSNFSGGQKQRLSIARAIVANPDIYIFDDSFSALDFKTDSKLRSALDKEVTSSIVIIVAQRVSTVKNADKILVLDEGELVGFGQHKELLENSKVYREIVSSQLGEEGLKYE